MYGSYGHNYTTATVQELLLWDSCVAMSGVNSHLKGGAIYQRWKPDDKAYDDKIASAMNHSRWLAIKRYVLFCFVVLVFKNLKLILPFSSSSTRTIKLCDNNLSPKKGNTGYDSSYKYDFAFKALIHNFNEMTFQADLDQCGDKTTIGYSDY